MGWGAALDEMLVVAEACVLCVRDARGGKERSKGRWMDGLGNRRQRWKLAGGRTLALDLDGGGGERMDSRGRQASNKQGAGRLVGAKSGAGAVKLNGPSYSLGLHCPGQNARMRVPDRGVYWGN